MYGDEAGPTPAKDEYAPKLAGVIRSPRLPGLGSDAGLPPLGDLFAMEPALPMHLRLSSPSSGPEKLAVPCQPAWDTERPYLTGRYLFDAATNQVRPAGARPPAPLESFPPQVQESLLVDDLLHAFAGLEGTWIRPKLVDGRGGTRLEYVLASRGQLDPALLEMATRMLPLCECFSVIGRFVETRRRYEWGVVSHALAGAMRGVMQDWELMLAQLEHQARSGRLTLQALWYYVQPPIVALRLVATLAADASRKQLRGAALLDLLHERTAMALGDASAHALVLRLLRVASEPYFAMLERWLCEGVVDDPYEEFMVQENSSIGRADLSADAGSAFWEDKFTLRRAMDPVSGAPVRDATGEAVMEVPSFLVRAKAAVLDAGKCVNLVKSCGKNLEEPPLPIGTRLEYDEGGRCVLLIERAHRTAAASAIALMRHEIGVSRGLKALKRYFLAAQGDLILGIMDGGEAELESRVGAVPLQQLQSIIDLAVRASSTATDPAAARLNAAYDHRSILNMLIAITQTAGPLGPGDSPTKRSKLRPVMPTPMTASEKATVGRQRFARESFMLSYEVPWPLSVVVPDAAMAQYQMIFRHLFELKWVERELNRVCGMYAATKSLSNLHRRSKRRESIAPVGSAAAAAAAFASPSSFVQPLSGSSSALALSRAYRTCQLMTHFFRQYLLYATFEVIEPLWETLGHHFNNAASVDEMIEHHRVFLKKVMKGLLLSRKVVVLRSLLALKQLALDFVWLSASRISVDWVALDAEVAELVTGTQSAAAAGAVAHATARGKEGKGAALALARQRKEARAMRLRSVLEAALSEGEFSAALGDLLSKFEARCGDFMAALAEAHRQALSERTDTREELEGLMNLMSRLDFNGYFAKRGMGPQSLEERAL